MASSITFTVLGSGGFIGSSLVKHLKNNGHKVISPRRDLSLEELNNSLAGHVIYCIGLTADFRTRPWETVDAHIGVLKYILERGNYSSLTYLSSTRVYEGNENGTEKSQLIIQPKSRDHLFNLSKLTGESMCYIANNINKPVRVVRLSNVLGNDFLSDNFLYSLLRDAKINGKFHLYSSLDTKKDYITLSDTLRMLELISIYGTKDCYNLASGIQISHLEIVNIIIKLTNSSYSVDNNSKLTSFPIIDISLLISEFKFKPQSPIKFIKNWMASNIN